LEAIGTTTAVIILSVNRNVALQIVSDDDDDDDHDYDNHIWDVV